MLTVVHVITRLELGGAQQNTLTTCQSLARAGHRVALVYGPGGPLDAQLAAIPGVSSVPVPELGRDVRPWTDARALGAVRAVLGRLLSQHDARGAPRRQFLVHTHSSKAGILGRAAAASMGLHNIIHSIHGFGFHSGQPAPVFRFFVDAERAMALTTRAFIAVSRANVAEAQARGILTRRHRVAVIRSGMDLVPFVRERERREAHRSELGLATDVPLFVSVANLKPQKDPKTVMAAMRPVVDALPGARLLYAGDGPLRTEVQAQIESLDLGAHVELLGWRSDVPRLMSAADVVVLGSRFEGLPRSAVQAVAAGRPFAGTRVDGTPEIIRAGRDGYLVEPGRPRDLARVMLRAYRSRPTDPRGLERLVDWSTESLVEKQLDLYRELAVS